MVTARWCQLLRLAGIRGNPSTAIPTATASTPLSGPYQHIPTLYCTSSTPELVDCVIIGAGVIGLACARAAALAGYETILLEKESTWGTQTSSRHSEVIHAGIYYPEGSLKARFCVEGKHLLYEYCREKGIEHKRIGKLIVAHSKDQIPKLQQFKQFATANGVPDLELLLGPEATAAEPALAAAAALLSPSTGIIDSHGYMESLLADASAAGAMLATHSKAQGVRSSPGRFSTSSSSSSSRASGSSSSSSSSSNGDGANNDSSNTVSSSSSKPAKRHLLIDVQDTTTGEVTQLATRSLVNAAGLHAQAVAATVADLPQSAIPEQYLAKGNYFTLSTKAPFSRLIYPLPEDGGLGVHLTLDLAGQAKFGPDVEWIDRIDYTVDPKRAEQFYPAVRQYYPGLPDGSLQPSYAGIRPKLSGPGQPAADFVIQGEKSHGVSGLVNLFGIESPGLTSSLAIAQAVMGMLEGKH